LGLHAQESDHVDVMDAAATSLGPAEQHTQTAIGGSFDLLWNWRTVRVTSLDYRADRYLISNWPSEQAYPYFELEA